ncbi:hypothetical protein LXL04_025332 [Taraxacum kok-saghyz]
MSQNGLNGCNLIPVKKGRNSHTRPLFALPHSRSSLVRSSAPASIDRSSLHRRRPDADHDQATTLTSSTLQASLASPNTGASPSPISHRSDFTETLICLSISQFIDFTVYRFSDSLSISQFIDFTDFTVYRFSDSERLLILHRHVDLFLDFLIQLQHKFWQPNVPEDSITAQFNYNNIQLQQNSITFLSITTNQTGPYMLLRFSYFYNSR